MANKPLQYVLVGRKMNVGPQAGKIVQVAQPTGRQRVDFGDLGMLKPSFKSKAVPQGEKIQCQCAYREACGAA